MDFLNALLAFAVTMIVLSTVVAAIVEFIQNLIRKRERYFRAYVLNFFDEQLMPALSNKIFEHVQAYAEATETARPGAKPKKFSIEWIRDVSHATDDAGVEAPRLWYTALPVVALVVAALFLIWTDSVAFAALVVFGAWYLLDRYRREIALLKPFDVHKIPLPAGLEDEKKKKLTLAFQEFRQKFANDVAKIRGETAVSSNYVARMTPEEFAAALGRSEVGAVLVDAGRDKLDDLITDVLRRFDDTGGQARNDFKTQASRLSVYVAFAVALVANVNAVTLIEAYFDDTSLAQRVSGAYTEAELQEMVQRHVIAAPLAEEKACSDKTLAADRKECLEDAIKEKNAESEANGLSRDDAAKAVAELKDELKKLDQQVNEYIFSLTKVGAPIGWKHYPYCVLDQTGEPAPGCTGMKSYASHLKDAHDKLPVIKHFAAAYSWVIEREAGVLEAPVRDNSNKTQNEGATRKEGGSEEAGQSPVENGNGDTNESETAEEQDASDEKEKTGSEETSESLVAWLVGIFAAGALIGLGGPFWFDTYKRLSAITKIARSFGIGNVRKRPSDEDAQSETTKPKASHAPETAVDAFKDAAAAKALTAAANAQAGQGSDADLANQAETEPEYDPDYRSPRRLLNDDGTYSDRGDF